MAIAQIDQGIVVNLVPLEDIPLDKTWRYVNQASANYDQKWYISYDSRYVYNANNDTVQEFLNIVARPVDQVYQLKIADLASLRWQKQNAGTILNGVPILTDDDSQSKILGARLSIMIDPTLVFNWKTPIGFIPLGQTEITEISDAVRLHIQACFDTEMTHIDALTALNDANDAQGIIDYDITAGWPITLS